MRKEGYFWLAKFDQQFRKLIEINKYIYEHTEFFEDRYKDDYPTELFAYFAGNTSGLVQKYNKFKEKLKETDRMKIKEEILKFQKGLKK